MPAITISRVTATLAALFVALACGALLATLPLDADASSAPALTVGAALDAPPVPAGFVGISLEYPAVAAYAGNPASLQILASLIRNLAPGQVPVLRIGGDSTDYSQLPEGAQPPPGIQYVLSAHWLRTLGALVHAAGAHVILGINLMQGNAREGAREAQALIDAVGPASVEALEVGNEPELYGHFKWYETSAGVKVYSRPATYSIAGYRRDFDRYARDLPDLPLAGPATGGAVWMQSLAAFIRTAPRLGLVTVHLYPLQRCYTPQVSDVYPTIAHLLDRTSAAGLAQRAALAISQARARGLEVRVDEMNSVSCRGSAGVSDTFASSLWILDALFSMAKAGVAGVNIHTLPGAAYQPFKLVEAAKGPLQWTVTPMYYGMLAFADAVPPGSQLLDLSGRSRPEVRTWAVLTPSHLVNVVVINEGSRAWTVPVDVPGAQGAATVTRLQAPSLEAAAGVTLAGGASGRRPAPARLGGRRRCRAWSPTAASTRCACRRRAPRS